MDIEGTGTPEVTQEQDVTQDVGAGTAPAAPAGDTPPAEAIGRRRFLEVAAGVSIGASCLVAGTTVARALAPPARSIDGKTKMPPTALVAVKDLKPGKPQIFPYGDDQVWIAKLAGDKVIALNAACPHVACKLSWDDAKQEYACPCHASFFALDGTRKSGPAPRNMDKAAFTVKDGQVIVSGFVQA